VGIQGKRQSQGRSLEAMEAKITAGFRFGKETTAVGDRQTTSLVFISLKNSRARQVLKVFSYCVVYALITPTAPGPRYLRKLRVIFA
jgi:hypothetical protein